MDRYVHCWYLHMFGEFQVTRVRIKVMRQFIYVICIPLALEPHKTGIYHGRYVHCSSKFRGSFVVKSQGCKAIYVLCMFYVIESCTGNDILPYLADIFNACTWLFRVFWGGKNIGFIEFNCFVQMYVHKAFCRIKVKTKLVTRYS